MMRHTRPTRCYLKASKPTMRWRGRDREEAFNSPVVARGAFTIPTLKRYHVGIEADAQGALVAHVVGNGDAAADQCEHTVLAPTSKRPQLTALTRHRVACLRLPSP